MSRKTSRFNDSTFSIANKTKLEDLKLPPQIKRLSFLPIYVPNHDIFTEKLDSSDSTVQLITILAMEDMCAELSLPFPPIQNSPVLCASFRS